MRVDNCVTRCVDVPSSCVCAWSMTINYGCWRFELAVNVRLQWARSEPADLPNNYLPECLDLVRQLHLRWDLYLQSLTVHTGVALRRYELPYTLYWTQSIQQVHFKVNLILNKLLLYDFNEPGLNLWICETTIKATFRVQPGLGCKRKIFTQVNALGAAAITRDPETPSFFFVVVVAVVFGSFFSRHLT